MLGDSHFLSGFMKVKSDFLRLGKFKIWDGSKMRLWEDAWFGDTFFKNIFSTLYDIVRKTSATVLTVFRLTPLNISFRRYLVCNNLYSLENNCDCWGHRPEASRQRPPSAITQIELH
jgi:hypothetical protein